MGHFQRCVPEGCLPFLTSFVLHSRHRVVFWEFGTVKGAGVYRSLFYRVMVRIDWGPIHYLWPVTLVFVF